MEYKLYEEWDDQKVMRHVVCAACKYGDIAIIAGARHYDKVMMSQLRCFPEDHEIRMINRGEVIQGFVDQFGNFMDRIEALYVAKNNGQLEGRKKHPPYDALFSEDLY